MKYRCLCLAALLLFVSLAGCRPGDPTEVPEGLSIDENGNPAQNGELGRVPLGLSQAESARPIDEMPDITNGRGAILPPPAAWDYAPPGSGLPKGVRGALDGIDEDMDKTAAEPPAGDESLEAQVIALTNAYRTEAGLAPLMQDEQLTRIARLRSGDMAAGGYFDAVSPTLGDLEDLLLLYQVDYTAAEENRCLGKRDPAEVTDEWIIDDAQAKHMLNPGFSRVGVGMGQSVDGIYYWVQILAD